jgi:hypothetical protein
LESDQSPIGKVGECKDLKTPTVLKPPSNAVLLCFWYGKEGHLCPNCLRCFNIYFMSIEERSSFVQDEFAALDAVSPPEKDLVIEEEVTLGFG